MLTTWEQIKNLAAKAGAKYPELVAAQWALESGFGSSPSGRNNFFGIKGNGTKRTTKEFINGKWLTIVDEFQDFETPYDCVKYLVDRWYLDYKTYKGLNAEPNRNSAARKLVLYGYATDPSYADKLIRLMNERAITSPPAPTMIGPKKKPQDFGFKEGDTHLIVNDLTEKATAYAFNGKKLWEVNCLARGQGGDTEFRYTNTDTPPGLYKIGQIYNDYAANPNPPYDRTLMAYGWVSFDLVELENQENKHGRAGIMIHGGGSANGWPGAWAPKQPLCTTYGCVRMYNEDLLNKLLPLTKSGTVYVSVYQES
jgi:hypothetical protein